MNILIPMGGIGSRFQKNGYRHPKPLINIVGRPMLLWLIDNLKLTAADTIFFGINAALDRQFQITEMVRRELPKQKNGPIVKVTPLHFDTRGAAETMYIILQSMSAAEKQRKTISLDCDTIYFSDVLGDFRELPEGQGACFYFEDLQENPVFSYILIDGENKIVDIQEKTKISTHANTGAYAFPSAVVLERYCAKILDEGVGSNGEYYTSHVIGCMIKDGIDFRGLFVKNFACVGTPWQLNQFLQYVKKNPKLVKPRRFCFDLDNTLVTRPVKDGDYSTVLPIDRNIRLAQELKEAGHCIVISTARRMRTHNGNIGAVVADVGMTTLETIAKFKIPCDEIYFGKPYAHVYIDDLAVHALLDTEKELGWSDNYASELSPIPDEIKKLNLIAPRSCNTIQVIDDIVIKSSTNPRFKGEVFFYENIPEDIKALFPKLIRADDSPGQVLTMRIERVRGVTFSHLLTGRCITDGRFKHLLNALKQVHGSEGIQKQISPNALGNINIYENYSAKLTNRWNADRHVYLQLSPEKRLDYLYRGINDYLVQYEANRSGIHAKVIHGDPVFSNILLTNDGQIKLIDMRGCLGDTLCIEGDILYDLAKVYQSLWGYDFVLIDRYPFSGLDVEMLAHLRELFRDFVQKNYSINKFRDIEMICASLLLSLIPLHDRAEHQQAFLKMCESIVYPFGVHVAN
ncbi:hypothetical protein MP638_005203 [Amoeboaphelidium occidentale]|nr:hypothetical protein MP638_005203 [Amoeboaphelidium occidentale]